MLCQYHKHLSHHNKLQVFYSMVEAVEIVDLSILVFKNTTGLLSSYIGLSQRKRFFEQEINSPENSRSLFADCVACAVVFVSSYLGYLNFVPNLLSEPFSLSFYYPKEY